MDYFPNFVFIISSEQSYITTNPLCIHFKVQCLLAYFEIFLKTWHCLKINANGKQGICNVKDHVNFVWLYPSMYGTVFIFYHQSVFLVTLHLVQWDMINQLCPVGIRLTRLCNFHIFDIRSRSFARHGGGGGGGAFLCIQYLIL